MSIWRQRLLHFSRSFVVISLASFIVFQLLFGNSTFSRKISRQRQLICKGKSAKRTSPTRRQCDSDYSVIRFHLCALPEACRILVRMKSDFCPSSEYFYFCCFRCNFSSVFCKWKCRNDDWLTEPPKMSATDCIVLSQLLLIISWIEMLDNFQANLVRNSTK